MNNKVIKLLTDEVNANLSFLLKVRPDMNEQEIKKLILTVIGSRVDIHKHFPETIYNLVNEVYTNMMNNQ